MARRAFFRLALRGLQRNPRRSLITLVAIGIGLAGLVFLWGYVDGINRQMIDNVTGYMTGHVQVHQKGYHDDPTLDLSFKNADDVIARLGGGAAVEAATPRIESPALASGIEKTRAVMVVGADPVREKQITTIGRVLRQGVYLDAADPQGVLIGDRLAAILNSAIGQEIALVTQAADGSIGAARYHVRGIFHTGIDLVDGSYVLTPLAAAQRLFALENQATAVVLRLSDVDDVPHSVAKLAQQLGEQFEVLGWEKLLPAVADDIKFFNTMTYIVLFVVFTIVTLGIANTVLMAVMERSHEFGVMLALGTSPTNVARVVLYEALILGLGGVVVGALLGSAIVLYYGHRGIDLGDFSNALQMVPGLTGVVYPSLHIGHLLILAVGILATTVAASVYPAWKAAGLSPVAAIRGARQANVLKLLPIRLPTGAFPRAVFFHIAVRGIARNPRRALLTLMALGAGLAAYLFLSGLAAGFYFQMRDNSANLLTAHVQIETKNFRDEYDAKSTLVQTDTLLDRVRTDPLVAAAAPRLQTQAMVSSPVKSEPATLYGVDPAAERNVTQLHEKLREGNYLTGGRAREVVVGAKLAERLKVRLGEKIVVMAPAADGSLGSAALRIVGIFDTGNDLLDQTVMISNIAAIRDMLVVPTEALTIAIKLHDIETADTASAAFGSKLTAANQQAVTWKQLVPEVVQLLDLIRIELRIILSVVFAIVALGVANTLLMAVLERTKEFGMQLSLGTRPAQIVRTVLYESLVLGIFGLAVGLILGALIVGYFHAFGFDLSAYAAATRSIPGLTSVVYPTIGFANVWLPILALLVTSMLAALYPAWRAARLNPVEALRRV